MKTVKSYIFALGAAAMLGFTLSGCQDDVDAPFIDVPVAVNEANTTIAELKAAFWQDASNYADTVRTKEDGSHYIIKGRVVSSDEQSNVFKFISLQDETGAITFSVNSYNLYLNYRRGQEIVVDATGMYIGKYAGLQQFGSPSYYENGSTWQVGFMSPQFFQQHIELNGVPDVAKLDTITINSFTDLDTSPEGLRKWQSRLVRFNNVHFLDGGVKTFSAYHSNSNDDVNKTLVDAEGNSNVVVRTSGYATFWNKMLPAGDGDVVGILSFYQNLAGASMWQLILNDYEGCMNFGNPTVAPGTETNPYSVAEVIKLEEDGTVASGWVTGYIVGSVAVGVETVTNDDIIWGEKGLMANTIVIGADKETKDLAQAIVVELPANTSLRDLGNVRDNPDNIGKQIWIRGSFEKVMGTYGLTGNSGASSQFKIEGVDGGNVPEGDGTADKPYNASQAKAKAIDNGSASTENVYVKGYIVSGSINMQYGTGTWTIANNAQGTGDTFELYGTYNTDNKKFTDENAVKVGDLVVAVGPIFNYNSKTPEMSKGHLVSINAGGSTVTPDPTPSGNVIFSESFENGSLGNFTTTVETSGSWTGWRSNTNSSSPACAIANSYTNSVNEAATAWLISPAINLVDAKTATVKVEQAFGFYFPTKQEEFCTLNIRETGGEWHQLTLTAFPEKGSGNWTSFAENTVDISAYAGKTVEVGFKYFNDGNQSVAWEIKNFKVIADGGSVTPDPTPNPDPDPDPTPDPTPSGDDVTIAASAITNVPGTTNVDGYTIVIDKASGATAPAFHSGTSSAIRLYADNTLQISGARMASITFTIADSNKYRYTTVTPSTGSITPAQASGDTSFTWVGDASSVTFTVGKDATLGSDGSSKRGQIHFTALDIVTAK